jgi:hypothetical protein
VAPTTFSSLNPEPIPQINQNFCKNQMRQIPQQGVDEGESVMLIQNQSSMTPQLAKVVQYPLIGNSSIHYRCSIVTFWKIKEKFYRLQQQQMIAEKEAAMNQLRQSYKMSQVDVSTKNTLPKTKN